MFIEFVFMWMDDSSNMCFNFALPYTYSMNEDCFGGIFILFQFFMILLFGIGLYIFSALGG